MHPLAINDLSTGEWFAAVLGLVVIIAACLWVILGDDEP